MSGLRKKSDYKITLNSNGTIKTKQSGFSSFKNFKNYFHFRKSPKCEKYIYASPKIPIPITCNRDIIRNKVGKYKEVVLPLYFGWEIVIRHREDWREQVIKPFKSYWQYMTVVAILIIAVSTVIFVYNYSLTRAATYNFVQTDWSGGASANNAVHSTDRTGWNEYVSKDSNLLATTDIVLTEGTTTNTETSDTDFNAGTTSTTAISGSGDDAKVVLATAGGSDGSITGYSGANVDIEISGNYAYLCNGASGISIIDISNPSSPSGLGSVDTGTCYGFALYGDYLYMEDINYIDIIDVSNPNSPSLVTSFIQSGGGNAQDVYISGTTLFIVNTVSGCGGYCTNSYLSAYSLSNPESPSLLDASNAFPGSFSVVYVDGDYAYIAGDEADSPGYITWYDISNPSSITAPVTTITTGVNSDLIDIISSGTYVYASQLTYGIRVVATSSPSLAATYDTNAALGIDINGNSLYVADANILLELDISNPLSISESNTYTSDAAYYVDYDNGYAYALQRFIGFIAHAIPSYASSGTFTSQIVDTTANSGFGTISWNSTEPTNTAITMKVRSDSNSDMSGATAWGSCNTVTSASDISSNNCVTDGHRYIQYQATLTTSDGSVTSQLEDVAIEYNSYSNGSLLGSAFNSEDSANAMGTISWTESGTGDVQLQIRTAPDSGGSPDWASGSGWCGPSNCAATTGDTDYAASYYTTSETSINSNQSSGDNDQWYQYRLWLTSADGQSTPTFSDLTIAYVVNAAPEFETTATASQGSDGLVTIDYSIRDSDTTSGSANPGYVTPSFQYSLDNGENWNNITAGLSSGATSTKAVDEASYTSYQATWTASDQINSYSTTAKIRVTVDDGEAANNTASSNSAAFTLDAKAPTAGSPAIFAVATTTPATLTLSASDDTSLQMCITLDNTESNCASYDTSSTISLGSDPDTVYVIFKDSKSNTTSANAVTPETPSNMIIRDLSNTSSGSTTPEYRLFISWAVVSTPVEDFANYEVWHSTDGSSYSLLSTITDRSINYYLHDSLSAESTHYYKISTTDNNGNTSYFSSVVSDTANGQGGTDASPPTISSVSTSNITTQGVTFTWTTDELSNSTLGYSTVAADFDTEVGVASMVTSHSVNLTGLTPNTTYYVQVKSADPDDNTATDNDGGDGYSFATLSGPAISNVSASTVQNTSATITWNTNSAADSTVYYSTNSDMSSSMSSSDSGSVTDHSVTISDLTAGTKYYFYVTSGVATDNNGGDYYYFNTTSDSTAPVITSVDASIITDDDAVITWITDEDATSKVSYGLASETYTTSTTETVFYNTSHSVTLSSLTNNTEYYYVVTSADSAGNTSTSTESTFTTLEQLSEESDVVAREEAAEASGASSVSCGGGGGGSSDRTPPRLINVSISSYVGESTVTWNTNENAISIVNYGIDSTDEHSITNPNSLVSPVTKHSVVLDNLIPNATYKYRAVAIDSSGNVGYSEEGTFISGDFSVDINTEGGQSDNKDEAILNSITQATKFFEDISTQVSLDTFESGVYEHISEIANIIPPPIISGEPVVTVGSQAATISWTTDDQANALVSYANEDYYLDNNSYQHTIGDPDIFLAGVHQVEITGLEPETIYHYKIVSKKQVGSTAQSKDFIFTTIPELAEIENYTTDIKSPEEVEFKWITTVPTDSTVKYTPYINGELDLDNTRSKSNEVYTTIHNITVDDLESGVLYQVEFSGETISGNIVNQIISSFATSDDNLAPIIRQVKTDAALSLGKETKVQAIISWYTNEPSSSRVYYEQGAGRADEELTKFSPLDENFARHHVVVITNFNPGSIYRFQVESIDGEGNASRSRTYTILTPKQQESVFQVIMKNIETTFGWLEAFR